MDILYRCSKCKEYKTVDCFDKDKYAKRGLHCQCKDCRTTTRNLPKNKAYMKAYAITYNKTEHGRAIRRKNFLSWSRSKRGRELRKAWKRSSKGKATISAWMKTDVGKANTARSNHTRRSRNRSSNNNLTWDEWKDILELQDNKCLVCGESLTDISHTKRSATREHIIPLRFGGSLSFGNVVALCLSCNAKSQHYYGDKVLYQIPDYITAFNAIT